MLTIPAAYPMKAHAPARSQTDTVFELRSLRMHKAISARTPATVKKAETQDREHDRRGHEAGDEYQWKCRCRPNARDRRVWAKRGGDPPVRRALM